MRSIVSAAVVIAAAQLSVPTPAEAQQVWKQIKEQTERKFAARKAKADSAAIARAAQTVDSTLAKTGRGVDTVVSKTASFADAVVDKTGGVLSSAAGALGGSDSEDDKLAADLSDGRAVLSELRFDGATEQLARSAEPQIERLVRLLKAQPVSFVIEGHVDDTGNAAADQALSERRAAALKARLTAAGVLTERLFAMGLGATRPPADPQAARARIEIARMK